MLNPDDTEKKMLNTVHKIDETGNLATNNFIKAGYKFAGWGLKPDGGVLYHNNAEVMNIAKGNETVTLYAIWFKNSYTVKYNANTPSTATSTVQNMPGNAACTYDTAVTLGSEPILKGWTFGGWYRDSSCTVKVGNAGEVKENANLTSEQEGTVTLYAKWIANNYTITYNENGGSGSMSPTKCTYDTPTYLCLNNFSRDGWIFDSWNTKPDGSGIKYSNTKPVSNLCSSGSITLYAIWVKIESSADFSGRTLKLGEGATHDDWINTGMSKEDLLRNGYKTIEVVITFDTKREDLIVFDKVQLAVVGNGLSTGWNAAMALISQNWETFRETFTIDIATHLNNDGSFSVHWEHLVGGGNGEHWFIGSTTVTVTAKK